MAKIIKVTGYLVGHDDTDEAEIALAAREILGSKFHCVEKPFKTESVSIGSDDIFYDGTFDNHPLNKFDCPIETCERYFQGE